MRRSKYRLRPQKNRLLTRVPSTAVICLEVKALDCLRRELGDFDQLRLPCALVRLGRLRPRHRDRRCLRTSVSVSPGAHSTHRSGSCASAGARTHNAPVMRSSPGTRHTLHPRSCIEQVGYTDRARDRPRNYPPAEPEGAGPTYFGHGSAIATRHPTGAAQLRVARDVKS